VGIVGVILTELFSKAITHCDSSNKVGERVIVALELQNYLASLW
jgi:hypothetical protein